MFREFATFLVEKYDAIVIDGGRAVSNEVVLAAAQVSAAVFLVIDQEFPSIRNAQRYITFLMRMGFSQDQIRWWSTATPRKSPQHGHPRPDPADPEPTGLLRHSALAGGDRVHQQGAAPSSPTGSRPAISTASSAPSWTKPPARRRKAKNRRQDGIDSNMRKTSFTAEPRDAEAVNSPAVLSMSSRPSVRPGSGADRWFELKSQVHHKLLNALTPEQLRDLNKESVRGQIGQVVEKLIIDESLPMTVFEREKLIEEILDEVFGLGPLEQLLKDSTISDIMVNGFDNVYVERAGRLVETNIRFKDQAHVRMIIERIVSALGAASTSPPPLWTPASDGSRVCAVIPPLSLIGPVMSIRRYGKKVLSTEDLLKNETFTTGMLDFMSGCVEARLNIVISGGSGSGKTTMLNTLSRFIPEEERIVTIEDTAELQLQQNHVVRLETRPSNIEGAGAVTQRDLVINTLRMRPDRIIVGESRGAEALDMLQAMNTGHDGSMTTVHANSAARRVFAARNHGHDGQPPRARQSDPTATRQRHSRGGTLHPHERWHP